MRTVPFVTAVLAATGLLTACTADSPTEISAPSTAPYVTQEGPSSTSTPEPTTTGPTLTLADGSLVVISASDADGATGTPIGGTVAIVGGGCVGVQEGDNAYTVVWPDGTSLTPDGSGLEVPGLGAVAVGDPLEGSGTRVETAAAPEDVVVPDVCEPEQILILELTG